MALEVFEVFFPKTFLELGLDIQDREEEGTKKEVWVLTNYYVDIKYTRKIPNIQTTGKIV